MFQDYAAQRRIDFSQVFQRLELQLTMIPRRVATPDLADIQASLTRRGSHCANSTGIEMPA
jgi:hypothetical protein